MNWDGWGWECPQGKDLPLWPSHPCAPCSPPGPCSRFAELFTTGLSTFVRRVLKPAPSPLASLFVSDLLCFFSFPVLLAGLLLFSINPFLVLPVLSHQLCGGFTGLPYLLFAPCFTEALNQACFYSLQEAWRPLAFWTTPLRGLGLAWFFSFLTHFLIFTQSLVLKLNNHMLDLFSLLFLTVKLKPSGITAGLELSPMCCARADPEKHLLLVVLRLLLGGWHHVLHSKVLSLYLVP